MNSGNNPNNNDNNFEAWFRNHYPLLILGFILAFSGLPILAPVLMKAGVIFPARVIYWAYSFFCHQLPFRSWFLFGVQSYYPLTSAGIEGILSFESIIHPETMDFDILRAIVGNSYAGYKIAICQRDIAINFSLLTFGIIFVVLNRRIKKIPLWIWLIVGVIPIGIDGITQYFGSLHFPILGVIRESTPLLRTITGTLFGLFTGWYIFPTLETIINRNKSIKLE